MDKIENEGNEEAAIGLLTCEETDIATFEEGDVNEKDPTFRITLAQAKDMWEKLFAFGREISALVKQAGTKMNADFVNMAE